MEAFHSTLSNFPFSEGCFNKVKDIASHNIPTLLIWGEKDAVCPYEGHKQVLEIYPKVSLVVGETDKR